MYVGGPSAGSPGYPRYRYADDRVPVRTLYDADSSEKKSCGCCRSCSGAPYAVSPL
jgi:hypothetical protein